VLELGGCKRLVGLPNNFGTSVPKLKRLEMSSCSNLRTLPKSLGLLTELEHLDVHSCQEMITLPNAIVGLVGLKMLNLSGCSKLEEMSMESARLINLEDPDVGLKKLKKLEMEATRVWPLPKDLGLLTSLSSLSMQIPKGVPEGFNRLKALTHLSVAGGEDVSMWLRDSLGEFTALQSLHMASVRKISYMPLSLWELKCLLWVVIRYCTDLRTIVALPQCLEHLELKGCFGLMRIPSLKPMKSLVYLNLEGCQQLRNIHGLECLTTLVFINVVNCASIEDHGVNVNKDNKALRVCHLSSSNVGVAYNNGWLEVRLLSFKFCSGVFLDIEPQNRMVAGLGCQFQFHTSCPFSSFM
jgi:Leucine-rich repeat (LRR) protein